MSRYMENTVLLFSCSAPTYFPPSRSNPYISCNFMTMTFDDRNPAFIYQGIWTQGGRRNLELNGTTTFTSVSGSTVSLTFSGKYSRLR